ncbi:MAG: hypothetical protein AAB658_04085, partial [Chloroflexota bacterium]
MTILDSNPIEYRIIEGHKASLLPANVDPAKVRRFAIIGGALMLAVLVGTIMGGTDPLIGLVAAAAPIGVLGLMFFLGRFELAPLVVLLAAAFLPVGLPTGTGSKLVASLVLT